MVPGHVGEVLPERRAAPEQEGEQRGRGCGGALLREKGAAPGQKHQHGPCDGVEGPGGHGGEQHHEPCGPAAARAEPSEEEVGEEALHVSHAIGLHAARPVFQASIVLQIVTYIGVPDIGPSRNIGTDEREVPMTKLDAQMRVGLRIKELRGELGLSQEAFAYSIEMSRTYLAEIEVGKRNVSVANIDRIARGLGLSLRSFFDSELFDEGYTPRDSSPTPR